MSFLKKQKQKNIVEYFSCLIDQKIAAEVLTLQLGSWVFYNNSNSFGNVVVSDFQISKRAACQLCQWSLLSVS